MKRMKSTVKIKKRTLGFTLIELIVFIVVLAIAAVTTLIAFQSIMTASPNSQRETVAIELAQARMDFIMGQFYQFGFGNFSDTCQSGSPPAVCLTMTGYTTTSSITTSGSTETITVTVTGLGSAILTTEVFN